MVIQRIAELLSKAKDPDRVFPATDLYNEGWMLRLVIDWFSRNPQADCDIQFLEGSRWYSEALLPSQFLARKRGDNLAESWTHADGVIGHFEIGRTSARSNLFEQCRAEFIRPGISVGQAREWSNEFNPTGLLVGWNDEGWGRFLPSQE